MPDHDNRSSVKLRNPSHDGRIIPIVSIAVKFDEILKHPLNIMGGLRSVDMPDQLSNLPSGQIGKYFFLQAMELLF